MQPYKHRIELDRFQEKAEATAAAGRCEGCCVEYGECDGPVMAVRVADAESGIDWGWFSYCETARSDDLRSGLFFPEAA